MTTMPRVECPECGRLIAAMPVAGLLGAGRLCRHDEPEMHRDYDGALVSCPGSLDIVTLPDVAQQLQLGAVYDAEDHDDGADTLF